MIVTVQLEEHDVLAAGGDTWPITRAILEAIEPGAGGHCVARIHTEAGGLVTQHHRLGVTIEIVPAPLAVAPPWPMVVDRRRYPFDNRTTVAESTGWQRHTMRATYRALRAAHQPWQARSAIVRLLNMDAALTHGRPVRGAA